MRLPPSSMLGAGCLKLVGHLWKVSGDKRRLIVNLAELPKLGPLVGGRLGGTTLVTSLVPTALFTGRTLAWDNLMILRTERCLAGCLRRCFRLSP